MLHLSEWMSVKRSSLGGVSLHAGAIQRIRSGGDDDTRGCEHVDSELQLSLIRGTVASGALLQLRKIPTHPMDLSGKSKGISCFSV